MVLRGKFSLSVEKNGTVLYLYTINCVFVQVKYRHCHCFNELAANCSTYSNELVLHLLGVVISSVTSIM